MKWDRKFKVISKLATTLLEKKGWSVTEAHGRQALELLAYGDFDLVLMDIQMPEMNGIEATKYINKEKTTGTHLPIIAMTAHAMQGEREKFLAAGMDDYISKPIEAHKLYTSWSSQPRSMPRDYLRRKWWMPSLRMSRNLPGSTVSWKSKLRIIPGFPPTHNEAGGNPGCKVKMISPSWLCS